MNSLGDYPRTEPGRIDKKALRRFHILTKPILPLLIKMAIPTIMGMLISVIYNFTDAFFIGILDNKAMTAAIGIVFSFVSIMQAIGFWFGYGSGNTMSRRIGANDEREAEVTSSLGVVLALGVGVIVAALSGIFVRPLAGFIGGSASPDLLRFTTQYLNVLTVSIPFILYSITVYNQLRLCGNARDAVLGLLAGMLSNIILDPILIFVFKLGFIGAAYATLAGYGIGSVMLTLLAAKNGNIPVRLNRAKFSKKRIYHILAGGAPNFSRQGITSIALVLLNIVAAKYGEAVIAALTVSSRIIAFPALTMIGWGQGFQPICAMNYGAKNYLRVKQAFKFTALIGIVFLTVSSVILYIFAGALLGYISKNLEVVAFGVELLRLQAMALPLLGFIAVSSMFMQNVGKYFSALIIATARQGTLYIPLLFILPAMFGQRGIYLVQPIADVLSFLLAVTFIRSSFAKILSE